MSEGAEDTAANVSGSADGGEDQGSAPQPLTPHRYPRWIVLNGLGILIAVTLSLVQLPDYVHADNLYVKARILAFSPYSPHNVATAIQTLYRALTLAPNSKKIRVELAVLYFESPGNENRRRGYEVLRGLKFTDQEWSDIQRRIVAGD